MSCGCGGSTKVAQAPAGAKAAAVNGPRGVQAPGYYWHGPERPDPKRVPNGPPARPA